MIDSFSFCGYKNGESVEMDAFDSSSPNFCSKTEKVAKKDAKFFSAN